MGGRIPQSFIDDLISRVDIIDVIDARVPLKKAGREYKACCPFHNEKTPSFTVSQEKQFYHCFGCGAHGTALGFLMEYDHLDFVEAVEELARQQGLEVPREGGMQARAPINNNKPLYELLERCNKFYQQQLRSHPQSGKAVDYLKGRGLSGEIARDFGLGYAPPGWDNLFKAIGREQEKSMLEAGLLAEKDERRYDRFRDRIMFPIRDRRGRVIGFGGRVLGDDSPKYLNSPETPVFHKGRELYGLYEVRKALRRIDRLLVVEGYMDVVALAQFDIRYAVATLGTSVTPEHMEALFKATDEVVFCFDGDRAGRDAAWRGLENALPQMRDGRQVRFMFLPEGEDPDTMVRSEGKAGFEARIVEAQPLSEFVFTQLRQQADIRHLDGQARLVALARPLLDKLPHGVYRQLMEQSLARLAGLDEGGLGKRPPQGGSSADHSMALPGKRSRNAAMRKTPSAVRHAITLLLREPSLAATVDSFEKIQAVRQPGIGLLVKMLELLHQNPHLTTGGILEHWRGQEEGKHLMALSRQEPLLDGGHDLQAEFAGALQGLAMQWRKQRREELLERFASLTDEEKAELKQLDTEAR